MRRSATVLVIVLVLSVFLSCDDRRELPAAAYGHPYGYEGTIVAAGDSLTAGYGVDEADAYPAALERKLWSSGYRWRVVNGGVSGETTDGLLSRVAWIMRFDPDIVVLETGVNDAFHGIDIKTIGRNINRAISLLKRRGVTVILAGMRLPLRPDPGYANTFGALYPGLAYRYGMILIPFFLNGVAGDPLLNQADGLHPTAQGYRVITEKIYPYVLQGIERVRRRAVKR